MEALGAAASAIALAQTAISLAQALNAYAGAVSDSVDDVVVIADDISDTYGNLQQLATVLEKNEKTGLLNEAAVSNAQRCVSKSEVLLKRLRKLFEKSGATTATDHVESGDIDISRFRRGIWIIYKSEFELRRAELHHIKADISLIYLTYLTMASGSEGVEKQQCINQMKLVYAKRTALDKDLKNLRARRRRDREAEGSNDSEVVSDDSAHQVRPETYDEDGDDDEPAAVFATIEDLYSEFNLWLAREKERDQEAASERENIEQAAVEKYLKQQKEAAQQIQTDAQRLRNTLTQHGLPPQKIDQIVKDAYTQANNASSQSMPAATPNGDRGSTQDGRSRLHSQSGTASSWLRRFSGHSDNEPTSNASGNVPSILRDASAPGGVAQLSAFYFQRVAIAPARYEIVKLEVAVPDFRLIPKLLSSELPTSSQKSVSTFLQGFGVIPEDYRYHITKELENLQGDPEYSWLILQIEPIKRQERIRRILRRDSSVVGVYVVLRKTMNFGNTYTERMRFDQNNTRIPVESASRGEAAFAAGEPQGGPALMSARGFQRGSAETEIFAQKRRNEKDVPTLVFASNPQRFSERGSPSRAQRHARFSENIEHIPSRMGRGRTINYASSDDTSEEYRVPIPRRRRRASTVESSTLPREQRFSVNPEDSMGPFLMRPSPQAREMTANSLLYRAATDRYGKDVAAAIEPIARTRAKIVQNTANSKGPWFPEARKMYTTLDAYDEPDEPVVEDIPIEEEEGHDSGRPKARRRRSRDAYTTTTTTTAERMRVHPTRSSVLASGRQSATSARQGRSVYVVPEGRSRSYRQATRPRVETESDSSSKRDSTERVRQRRRSGYGVSADDAVQGLLTEWTNPRAVPREEVKKPADSVVHQFDAIRIVEDDQKNRGDSNYHPKEQALNAPTVKSGASSAEKRCDEQDKSLSNGDLHRQKWIFD